MLSSALVLDAPSPFSFPSKSLSSSSEQIDLTAQNAFPNTYTHAQLSSSSSKHDISGSCTDFPFPKLRNIVLICFPSEGLDCVIVSLLELELVTEGGGGGFRRAMVGSFFGNFGSGVEQFMRKKKVINKQLTSTKKIIV